MSRQTEIPRNDSPQEPNTEAFQQPPPYHAIQAPSAPLPGQIWMTGNPQLPQLCTYQSNLSPPSTSQSPEHTTRSTHQIPADFSPTQPLNTSPVPPASLHPNTPAMWSTSQQLNVPVPPASLPPNTPAMWSTSQPLNVPTPAVYPIHSPLHVVAQPYPLTTYGNQYTNILEQKPNTSQKWEQGTSEVFYPSPCAYHLYQRHAPQYQTLDLPVFLPNFSNVRNRDTISSRTTSTNTEPIMISACTSTKDLPSISRSVSNRSVPTRSVPTRSAESLLKDPVTTTVKHGKCVVFLVTTFNIACLAFVTIILLNLNDVINLDGLFRQMNIRLSKH